MQPITDYLHLLLSTVKCILHSLIMAGLIEKEPYYQENRSTIRNRLILKVHRQRGKPEAILALDFPLS